MYTLHAASHFVLIIHMWSYSVQFSRSVMPDSMWHHGLQHARLPCPSPTPEACSNSCPLSQWCHPTISSSVVPFCSLPSIFPSIRVFSNESALCIRWPKYWSFSFSISPSNEHPGLISFRMDWVDLLAVQGTLKSLLQHHSPKALILWCSALLICPFCSKWGNRGPEQTLPLIPQKGTEFMSDHGLSGDRGAVVCCPSYKPSGNLPKSEDRIRPRLQHWLPGYVSILSQLYVSDTHGNKPICEWNLHWRYLVFMPRCHQWK